MTIRCENCYLILYGNDTMISHINIRVKNILRFVIAQLHIRRRSIAKTPSRPVSPPGTASLLLGSPESLKNVPSP